MKKITHEDRCSVCRQERRHCLEHYNMRPGAATGGVFLGVSPRMAGGRVKQALLRSGQDDK